MTDTKSWYESRTVWGSIVAVGASLAGSFGLAVEAQDQLLIVDTTLQAISAAGAIVALYGRFVARSRIV